MSFHSEEQWVEVSTCLCGAAVYKMGERYRCPDCFCNATTNNITRRVLWNEQKSITKETTKTDR